MKWWYENDDLKERAGKWIDYINCEVLNEVEKRKKESKMEFDKSRCYSAINADELKQGDKVIVAMSLSTLREHIEDADNYTTTLKEVLCDDFTYRFVNENSSYPLAYLVEKGHNCTNCAFKETAVCDKSGWREADVKVFACGEYKPKTERVEKKYRPFKDTDELIKVWNKKFYLDFKPSPDPLTMPYIWVRQKECSKGGLLITYFGEDEVKTDMGFMPMRKLLADFTFTDRSPCGVEE